MDQLLHSEDKHPRPWLGVYADWFFSLFIIIIWYHRLFSSAFFNLGSFLYFFSRVSGRVWVVANPTRTAGVRALAELFPKRRFWRVNRVTRMDGFTRVLLDNAVELPA